MTSDTLAFRKENIDEENYKNPRFQRTTSPHLQTFTCVIATGNQGVEVPLRDNEVNVFRFFAKLRNDTGGYGKYKWINNV